MRHLQTHVNILATGIGGRLATSGLERAASYIDHELRSYGYAPQRQTFSAAGHTVANIEAEIPGVQQPDKIVVVGAHYDTAGDLPGANDNGSGVAATLELARYFATIETGKAIRFVFFANEEPPNFQTPSMGSYVYAKRCSDRREKIVGMLTLKTIGYYIDEPGSQSYPIAVGGAYPDRGNFLGFVGDLKSASLLRTALKAFRESTALPAQRVTAPNSIPGVGWSDHWSFWQFGYRALMLTDTAPFRDPHYQRRRILPTNWTTNDLHRQCAGFSEWSGDSQNEAVGAGRIKREPNREGDNWRTGSTDRSAAED